MRLPTATAALCLALAGLPAAAQTAPLPPLWKWVDASGQVQFSDLPPPLSVPDMNILERPPLVVRRRALASATGAVAPALPGLPRTDPELEARRRRLADSQSAEQRRQQERDDALRADNCNRAREHLAALADGLRMTRSNARGEREVLDDKGRAEEMHRSRGVIASDCRPAAAANGP